MRGRVVALEGPSAAGKTATAQRWAARGHGVAIAEAYARLRPRPSLALGSPAHLRALELALLREDARRLRAARRRAAAGSTVLLDTGALGPLTYTAGLVRLGAADPRLLDRLLREAAALRGRGGWSLPDAVVFLETPVAGRRRRAALDPAHHPAPLRSRHARVGAWEARFYRSTLAPLLGRRFLRVAGRGPPDEVAERVAAAIARGPASRTPPALELRVLAALARVGARARRPRPRGNS